jgi:RNA polymerase sigma-70 factor (ECF subfamily)
VADRSDFDRLVRPLLPRCLHTAGLILENPASAEDAVQDALVRAWTNWHTYDPSRPLERWLLRIVTNEALRFRRSWFRPWQVLSERVSASSATDGDSGIARLFSQLRPSDRAILALRYFWGYSTSEVGQILGVPEGTVASRVSRASARAHLLWKETA